MREVARKGYYIARALIAPGTATSGAKGLLHLLTATAVPDRILTITLRGHHNFNNMKC